MWFSTGARGCPSASWLGRVQPSPARAAAGSEGFGVAFAVGLHQQDLALLADRVGGLDVELASCAGVSPPAGPPVSAS